VTNLLLAPLTERVWFHVPVACFPLLPGLLLQGKRLDIVRSEVVLSDLVGDVHCIIEAMIGRGGTVTLHGPQLNNVPEVVCCDPDRLRGVLLNLYTNAGEQAAAAPVAAPEARRGATLFYVARAAAAEGLGSSACCSSRRCRCCWLCMLQLITLPSGCWHSSGCMVSCRRRSHGIMPAAGAVASLAQHLQCCRQIPSWCV
jgi:hypothetical protein